MNAIAAESQREELGIFAERFMHFMNLWTIYRDLLSKHYVPSIGPELTEANVSTFDKKEFPVAITMMLVLYSYFYSLIEDSEDGLNGFRIWLEVWPSESTPISAVESRISPFRNRLRVFRNRLGFHGSRNRDREEAGFELFNKHSGTEVFEAIKLFKSLGAALFAMDMATRSNDPHELARARAWIDSVTSKATAMAKTG